MALAAFHGARSLDRDRLVARRLVSRQQYLERLCLDTHGARCARFGHNLYQATELRLCRDFSTRSIELLLNKIEAIAVEQTLVGRMFGYGDIVITGSGGTKEAFSRIQSPLEFRRAVQSVADVPVNSPPATAPRSGG
ncbi:MAG: PH domain-containing protein [Betaproteobacteria bacterium]|nr:MAG: PH domain-containing protein [Betaproteobacteria bacterium]